MTAYIVSNPTHLTRNLSLGMIGPAAIYGEKFVEDGSTTYGGCMVLHATPPPSSWPGIEAGILLEVSLEMDSGSAIMAVDTVHPREVITRVHFHERRALEEFVSTPFSNADPSILPCEESPQLFGDDDTDEVSATAPSASADDGDDAPAQGSLLDARGADDRAVLGEADIEASSRTSRLQPEDVAIVDRTLGAVAEALRPPAADAGVAAVAASLLNNLAVGSGAADVLAAGVGEPDGEAIRTLTLLLADRSPTDVAPKAILEEAVGKLTDRADALGAAVEIARNRRDLEGPEEFGDPVIWAFLVSVLAKGTDGARERAASAAPEVGQLVMWFSGARHGYARTPWDRRDAALDPLLRRIGRNLLSAEEDREPIGDITAAVEDLGRIRVHHLLLPDRYDIGTEQLPDPREVLLAAPKPVWTLIALSRGGKSLVVRGSRLESRSIAVGKEVRMVIGGIDVLEAGVTPSAFEELVRGLDDDVVDAWVALLPHVRSS